VAAGWALGLPHVLPFSLGDLVGSLLLQVAVILTGLIAVAELLAIRFRLRGPDGGRVNGLAGWRQAWAAARRGPFSLERAARYGTALLGVVLLGRAFIAWKSAIPRLAPFGWDPFFSRLDWALHGGIDPWRRLQPVLGHEPVTRLLDGAYLIWHPVLIGVVVWFAARRDRETRGRFFLSFALCWMVIGTGLALLFSSAGPCFFGPVAGDPDRYAPLFAYLARVDEAGALSAVRAQQWLWENYRTGQEVVSISAMPSMHVAMPVLYVLAVWPTHPRLRWLFVAYAAMIFLGSVHLGWHYAVDGYLAALVAALIWRLTAGRAAFPRLTRAPS